MRRPTDIDRRHLDAIADADPYPYWYDDADEPDSQPDAGAHRDLRPVRRRRRLHRAVDGDHRQGARPVARRRADRRPRDRLGGQRPQRRVHGVEPDPRRRPTARSASRDELPLLEELGLQNLDEIEAAIQRYDIDCDYERTGVIDVATTRPPAELPRRAARRRTSSCARSARTVEWLDAEAMRAQVDSPTYTGGLWRKDRAALVDPARLVWGLKAAAESLGVRIYEDTKATALEQRRRRRARHDAARPRPGRQGGAGDERVQAAAASG